MNIDKSNWHICKICNQNIQELKKLYGGKNIYFTKVFKQHLEKDHSISIEKYFDIDKVCPCGVCNKKLGIKTCGSNFAIKKYACGRNEGVQVWSKEAKTSRLGSKNPMYGKKPWNKNYKAENHPSLKIISDKKLGQKPSEETRKKQSDSAKARRIHGHTGFKHTEKTKKKLRENTLKMINEGRYNSTKTKPHNFCKTMLDRLNIEYEEEKIIKSWAFDFYLTNHNIFIEIDGDYFHSNPKIYPNGPKTKTQKNNFYRDIKKNDFCKKNKLNLIRFWESDILNMEENEFLCKLNELFQLEK
jgi:very-short-patch-repair endonuclease